MNTILVLLIIVATPIIALAAPQTFSDLSALLVHILNMAAGLVVSAGIAAYMYRVMRNIGQTAEGRSGNRGDMIRKYFFWGILAIFVMVSVWGILALLQNTLWGTSLSLVSHVPLWS